MGRCCGRGVSVPRSTGTVLLGSAGPQLVSPGQFQFTGYFDLSGRPGAIPPISGLVFLRRLLTLLHDLGVGLCARATPEARRLDGQTSAHRVAGLETAELALGICLHEGSQRDESGAHTPCRLPGLLVVAADRQADLTVGLEAARGRYESERRRTQRVHGGEDDAPVVDAAGEGGVGRAPESEVPFE